MTGDALGTRCYLFALLLIQKRGEFSRLQSRCIEWGWGLVSTRGLVGHTRGLIGQVTMDEQVSEAMQEAEEDSRLLDLNI